MKQLIINNKNFRKYLVAISITQVGDYIDDIAFALLIYTITESTLCMSYVFAIKIILTFCSIFTATYVDYNNKARIIGYTSIGQGILLTVTVLFYKNQIINIILLMIIVTIQTIFSTFSVPAQNAILPLLVTEKDTINARVSLSISSEFIQILGYFFASIIISKIGISGAMIIDIITFVISGLIILSLKYDERKNGNTDSIKKYFERVCDGVKFVIQNKVIKGVLLITFLGNMFVAPVDSLMTAYFSQSQYNDNIYAYFMVVLTCGGLVGSYFLTKFQTKLKNEVLFSVGFIIGGIGIITLFFNKGGIPFFSGLLIGISYGVVSVMNATILQEKTPSHMLARTFSFF